MTDRLSAHGLQLGYGDRVVARDLGITVPDGSFTVIIGPNACGKSTLLRALARLLRPTEGSVVLDGRDIHSLPSRAVAQKLGLLPQSSIAPEGIRVVDLVARGRFPHQRMWRQWSQEDRDAVDAALAVTGTTNLRDRLVEELSGGQRQRVWIAMVLAQDTPLLLLDEPTTFLDIAHQVGVMDLCSALHRRGRTVVAVLHDLNQACRYATHIVAMREGEIIAAGRPADVINADLVQRVFDLPCVVIEDPVTGSPLVLQQAPAEVSSLPEEVAHGNG